MAADALANERMGEWANRGLPAVHIHEFERDDSVRGGLVRAVIDRYDVEE